MGSCGVQIESHRGEAVLLAYFEAAASSGVEEQLGELLGRYGLPNAEILLSEVENEDWEAVWRQFYSPIWATTRIVVHPSWIPVEIDDNQISIAIDPKMAFGTGEHESTQLCLQLLEEVVRSGDHCLDLGSGSGILSIAASRLGAGSILALDIDPDAVINARDNVVRNAVAAGVVEVALGSIGDLDDELFDLIVGNIQSSVLRPMLTAMRQRLSPGRQVILSGLLKREQAEFCEEVEAADLRVSDVRAKGDWICVSARRVV